MDWTVDVYVTIYQLFTNCRIRMRISLAYQFGEFIIATRSGLWCTSMYSRLIWRLMERAPQVYTPLCIISTFSCKQNTHNYFLNRRYFRSTVLILLKIWSGFCKQSLLGYFETKNVIPRRKVFAPIQVFFLSLFEETSTAYLSKKWTLGYSISAGIDGKLFVFLNSLNVQPLFKQKYSFFAIFLAFNHKKYRQIKKYLSYLDLKNTDTNLQSESSPLWQSL